MTSTIELNPQPHDPDATHGDATSGLDKEESSADHEEGKINNDTTLTENGADRRHSEKFGNYDRYEITEEDCWDELGFSFPTWKKWSILSVIFLVQVSMNFNSLLYSNGIKGITKEFHVSAQAARVGAAVFLVTYAFGCEIFAPWSEELGRWPVLQLSLFLLNVSQIPVGVAPNFGTIIAFRVLGGLCTAGGSVTLAMVADIWGSSEQQYAVVSEVDTHLKLKLANSNRISSFLPQWAAQS